MQLQLQHSSFFASPANHAVGPLIVVAVILERDSAMQQAQAVAKQNECLQSEVRARVPKALICLDFCITACCQLVCVRVCACVCACQTNTEFASPDMWLCRVRLLCRR